MKPLLLLDVDGVLCPFGQAEYPHTIWSMYENIRYSPDNVYRLASLMIHFDLVWCTAWGEDANRTIKLLHLLPRDLPVVDLYSDPWESPIHWKYDGIQLFVENRPYAFVDDEITDEGVEYADWRTIKQGIPTLWLPTVPTEGLTTSHVETLITWAGNVTAAQAA